MTVQQLSTITPDPEDIVTQLQIQLGSKNSWKDLLTSAVGQTILEFVAAVGANDQYAIERVFKEMFPQTARLDSSIYAITRLLGVRLQRKNPAYMQTVQFVNTGASILIPEYSQFSVGGYSLFNRVSLTVPTGTTNFTLYEGEVRSAPYTATGNSFQTIISNETGFVIAEEDIVVRLNNVFIPRTTSGLWNYKVITQPYSDVGIVPVVGPATVSLTKTDIVIGTLVVPGFTVVTTTPTSATEVQIDYAAGTLLFYTSGIVVTPITVTYDYSINGVTNVWQDLTTPEGNLQIQFGNSLYGFVPPISSNISLVYVVTKGTQGNDSSIPTGQKVSYSGQPSYLTITAQSGLEGGTDEIAASLYKNTAPQLFAASLDRAVTQQDYNAVALGYPGMIDVVIQGQRDIDPNDVTYMNLARVWMLHTGSDWAYPADQNLFDDFTEWLKARSMFALRFYYDTALAALYGISRPVPINITVGAEVSIQNFADPTQVLEDVNTALDTFFALKYGSISRDIYISDIISVIKQANSAIDFVILRNPTTNIITNYNGMNPEVTSYTTGGTLPAGTYEYRIVANFGAPLYPAPVTTNSTEYVTAVTTGATSSVLISWQPLAGALSYDVYGRVNGSLGFLINTSNRTFLDTNALPVIPATLPEIDETGLRYPRLFTKNINTVFTYR